MASPCKTGSSTHEIVLRRDATCIQCRGRCIAGGRAWWNKETSQVWHVVCPPVVEVAPQAYQAPPITPERWKEFCRQIQQATTGLRSEKKVLDEDRKAYEAEGPGGMLRSVINRTRCTGQEAVEIARQWIDSLKAPVDEERFQKLNRSLGESSRKARVAQAAVREAGEEG